MKGQRKESRGRRGEKEQELNECFAILSSPAASSFLC